jgi:hypothetical protein
MIAFLFGVVVGLIVGARVGIAIGFLWISEPGSFD